MQNISTTFSQLIRNVIVRYVKDIPEHTIDISENGKSEAMEKLEAEQDAVMRERFARMKALLNK